MIDWRLLSGSALWIIALAAALAYLSYLSWHAALHSDQFSQRIRRTGAQAGLSLCAASFCAGLALLAQSVLALIVWIILGALFLLQAALALRQSKLEK